MGRGMSINTRLRSGRGMSQTRPEQPWKAVGSPRRSDPETADRILPSQAMVPTSVETRNSDSRPIGNFGMNYAGVVTRMVGGAGFEPATTGV